MRPKVYVELPPAVKDKEKLSQFLSEWRATHSGADNQHRAGFIPTGTKVTSIPINNQDCQFIEAKEQDLISIANILSLPPHKLGAKISSSYASLEAENEAFPSRLPRPVVPTMARGNRDATLLTEERETKKYKVGRGGYN